MRSLTCRAVGLTHWHLKLLKQLERTNLRLETLDMVSNHSDRKGFGHGHFMRCSSSSRSCSLEAIWGISSFGSKDKVAA